jgi:hypothetical protein
MASFFRKRVGWLAAFWVLVALALIAQIHVQGLDLSNLPGSLTKVSAMDLSAFASDPPGQPLDLLFIHHSVGGQWLADPGPETGENSIHITHPSGGSLRARLLKEGYRVHEASYGSALGEQTDLFDWLPKFRDHMPQIRACATQDTPLAPPANNRIILFKSCYPNNAFQGPGQSPGSPAGPDLTLANAQAAYRALLPEFQKYPAVLFICITTPPEAPCLAPEPLWKATARKLLGKGDRQQTLLRRAALARQFANWLKSDDGWLKDYPLRNVVTFDYYDILTGASGSDLLHYPTDNGTNSHPSAEGQRAAADAFLPFLNRAVRRADLIQ